MSSDSGATPSDSTLQLIAKKIRSQFLLFCIAIALVIVTLIQTAGTEAAMPVGAVLIVFFVGALVYSFVEKDKGPASRALEVVPDSKGGDLAIQVWIKHVASGKAEGVYHVGDEVRVCVRATADCYLTLLNLASDGEMTILFPNQYCRNHSIQGGITQEIPSDGYGFNIVLEEPVGLERLKAIATLDSKPLLETQFNADGEFFQSFQSNAVPRAMRVVAANVEKRKSKDWAAASTQFKVEKR